MWKSIIEILTEVKETIVDLYCIGKALIARWFLKDTVVKQIGVLVAAYAAAFFVLWINLLGPIGNCVFLLTEAIALFWLADLFETPLIHIFAKARARVERRVRNTMARKAKKEEMNNYYDTSPEDWYDEPCLLLN